MYLLDTNTVIKYLDGSLPPSAISSLNQIVDVECNISIITKIEALGFDFKTIAEQTAMEDFIGGSVVFELDHNTVNITIGLRKKKKIKTPDAIIAATALLFNLTLISRNVSDFKNIAGLAVIDPNDL